MQNLEKKIVKLSYEHKMTRENLSRVEKKVDTGFQHVYSKLDEMFERWEHRCNKMDEDIELNTKFRMRIAGQIALIGGILTGAYSLLQPLIKFLINKIIVRAE